MVHGFTIKCAVYGSLAARAAGVPGRVNAVAGMGYVFTSNEPKARLLRPVVRSLLRIALDGRGARLILQNPDDVALFERARLVAPDRVCLIRGSGVDCARFAPRQGGSAGGEFRALLASRLLRDKGVLEFVEAARILKTEQGRAVTFVLAGAPDHGNPASISEEVVRAWADEGLVEWPGHVEDMPALLSTIDVAVLPSYREGLPRSLIEAAASGLPLITTDVPGCREVVADGVNGLMVPPRDARALAAAVARLQDNPDLALRLGQAGRARALAEFDERFIVAQTLAVYANLLPTVSSDGASDSM